MDKTPLLQNMFLIANELDDCGMVKEASAIDAMIVKIAADASTGSVGEDLLLDAVSPKNYFLNYCLQMVPLKLLGMVARGAGGWKKVIGLLKAAGSGNRATLIKQWFAKGATNPETFKDVNAVVRTALQKILNSPVVSKAIVESVEGIAGGGETATVAVVAGGATALSYANPISMAILSLINAGTIYYNMESGGHEAHANVSDELSEHINQLTNSIGYPDQNGYRLWDWLYVPEQTIWNACQKGYTEMQFRSAGVPEDVIRTGNKPEMVYFSLSKYYNLAVGRKKAAGPNAKPVTYVPKGPAIATGAPGSADGTVSF